MDRIGTVQRLSPARIAGAGDGTPPAGPADRALETPRSRALVVIDGGRRSEEFRREAGGRPEAGFVAHLLTSRDPTLAPSRLERTRSAAALYASAGRRLA